MWKILSIQRMLRFELLESSLIDSARFCCPGLEMILVSFEMRELVTNFYITGISVISNMGRIPSPR